MSTHKATSEAWEVARHWANQYNLSTDSVLLEVADRVAALEKDSLKLACTGIDHEQRITALENASQATTEESSAVAPDLVHGANAWGCPECVRELRAALAAQPRQEEPAAPPPTYELTDVAPLLWALWHHLGASSPVGQPIRRYLGMGQHDRMTPEQVEAVKRWARESMSVQDCLDSIPVYGSTAAGSCLITIHSPPPTIDALIKAECALADIAEEQPNISEGDALKWAKQRCTATLAIIRPVMRQHGITTSEWPPAAQPTPPPAPAGDPVAAPSDLVETADAIADELQGNV